MATKCTANINYKISHSKFEVSGHQGPYLAKIHDIGDVCGHQGPYFIQLQSNNNDVCKIRATVSG